MPYSQVKKLVKPGTVLVSTGTTTTGPDSHPSQELGRHDATGDKPILVLGTSPQNNIPISDSPIQARKSAPQHLEADFHVIHARGDTNTHVGGIDSMTRYKIVSEAFANLYPDQWLSRDDSLVMRAANGRPCRRLGTFSLTWKFSNTGPTETATCQVIKDFPIDICLGNEWSNDHVISISWSSQTMTIRPKESEGVAAYVVPIRTTEGQSIDQSNAVMAMVPSQDRRRIATDSTERVVMIKSCTRTVVEPWSHTTIQVYRADNQLFVNGQCLIPEPSLFAKHGLVIAAGLSTPTKYTYVNIAHMYCVS